MIPSLPLNLVQDSGPAARLVLSIDHLRQSHLVAGEDECSAWTMHIDEGCSLMSKAGRTPEKAGKEAADHQSSNLAPRPRRPGTCAWTRMLMSRLPQPTHFNGGAHCTNT